MGRIKELRKWIGSRSGVVMHRSKDSAGYMWRQNEIDGSGRRRQGRRKEREKAKKERREKGMGQGIK